MGRKSIISDQQKIKAVTSYLNGKASVLSLCNKLQVHKSSFRKWVIRYKSEGEAGLKHSSKNTPYVAETKINIVREYLDGLGSLNDLCIKYHISSNTVLCKWIKKYNGHENIKSSGSGGENIMTKGRKTSYNERIDIIKYCIENNNDYNKTVQKYEVSYPQIYSWMKKYEQFGIEGLVDRRGKPKDEELMTESEKLKAQYKLLEAQNRRLRMENALIKKIQEIERRRY
ncbi:helix-turn-helix domain-containing protein [Clostridium lacusfryxellense]|uniref:helix-turn-helix domain-containing protein n=1 Tax=Clostridium lacusfryxellense TaxID=205328 RepID=UPI001C0AD848|nr:helix-turn-helix domain-containing protein [Clostridium lacusfryxellense]MBU3114862.1 helix-turn-helix domain-containing protein [Clostridium lacusfryxellense]